MLRERKTNEILLESKYVDKIAVERETHRRRRCSGIWHLELAGFANEAPHSLQWGPCSESHVTILICSFCCSGTYAISAFCLDVIQKFSGASQAVPFVALIRRSVNQAVGRSVRPSVRPSDLHAGFLEVFLVFVCVLFDIDDMMTQRGLLFSFLHRRRIE